MLMACQRATAQSPWVLLPKLEGFFIYQSYKERVEGKTATLKEGDILASLRAEPGAAKHSSGKEGHRNLGLELVGYPRFMKTTT